MAKSVLLLNVRLTCFLLKCINRWLFVYFKKMNELRYQTLLQNSGAALFLSKPYGLELLYVLDKCNSNAADNGIDDTFDLILFNKPRREAFHKFVQLLANKHHLLKLVSGAKASKTVLRMSIQVSKAFKAFKEP